MVPKKEDKQIQIPFLKWAGGKRWLAREHKNFFPESYKTYYEPFLGSGAMFFAANPNKAVLSDVNEELITTFQGVRDTPTLVRRYLLEHSSKHSKEYYYATRSKKPRSAASIAARMIYLNRTCWNGLYRVNVEGSFNVPIGTNTKATLPTDDFPATSNVLGCAEILPADFEASISRAKEGDFVFADPPYTVKHNVNGFVQYNEKLFRFDDQIRLRDALARASQCGVKFLVTNANHKSIRALYAEYGFKIEILRRQSVVAASSEFRNDTTEIVISNYR